MLCEGGCGEKCLKLSTEAERSAPPTHQKRSARLKF